MATHLHRIWPAAILAVGLFLVLTGAKRIGIVDQLMGIVDGRLEELRIVDGDSLELSGRRIRLYGIDAPELAQLCRDQSGREYPCGLQSREALRTKLHNQRIDCRTIKNDSYGRELATCTIRANGMDVAAWQVMTGNAVAYTRYTDQYRQLETNAKAARKGLWRGAFTEPEQWRREHSGATQRR